MLRVSIYAIALFVVSWVKLTVSTCWAASAKPNMVIIMADDCTFNDLPMYGGQNARTPNLDRLARQGLVFEGAFLSEAMCQPCRSELYSGQFPARNGCAWNHSTSRSSTTSLPHHLGKLGYRVGLAGKVHVLPQEAYPFEAVGGFDASCTRNPTRAHDLTGMREFISRDPVQPYLLVVALVEPHLPWVMGDASEYPPELLKLPPYLADNTRTRQDFAAYLAEISYMDSQVGEILTMLDELDQSRNTLVLFTSEQGAQFPGCKWTNWNTGVHTALIARWHQRIQPNTRTSALVQYADVLPTLIDIAGGQADSANFDGSSFLQILTTEKTEHRRFAYGIHNNIPEGPAYPIRSVTDGRFHLIRNLTSNEMYIEKHVMGVNGNGQLNNPYWATWIWDSWNNRRTYDLVHRYTHRPSVELYDLQTDPYELTNLANDRQHNTVRATLQRELDRWLEQQLDPGSQLDTLPVYEAARKGIHSFPLPSHGQK